MSLQGNATPAGQIVPQRASVGVWVGLTIAVLLDAPVQLMWKALMAKYGDPAHGPQAVDLLRQARWFLHQTRTLWLIVLFLCQFINWMWVLGKADLSYAQPFTALSYVVVSGCAAFFFHEHLSAARIAGILLVLCGVILVSISPQRTTSALGAA